MENNNQKNNATKWLALANIPIQMGVIIFLFYKLGFWLDENHPSEKVYYYKLLTLLGVFLALFNVYRQVNQIGNKS
ncbi:AtpZ/AtpI family protein [Flavobacterium sp.]|uniref:AtpZ/AtpI family protein n=1 Tax=Flavobacterium sp. TaxID=239 RepID=UPI002608E82F|nr:AtpZ/AtpI family protein [Flavobacterium sp.]